MKIQELTEKYYFHDSRIDSAIVDIEHCLGAKTDFLVIKSRL
jgi:hypothetical protein